MLIEHDQTTRLLQQRPVLLKVLDNFYKTKTMMPMFVQLLLTIVSFAIFPFVAFEANAQVVAIPRLVERLTNCNPCGVYVVNEDPRSRVVVTLRSRPDFDSFQIFDRNGQTLTLQDTTRPVLLQAGEQRFLSSYLVYETFSGAVGMPPFQKKVSLQHQIVGHYVPAPDLSDLPHIEAENYIRLYEQHDLSFSGTDVCRLGSEVREPRSLVMRNLSITKSIRVRYRNQRPGLNKDWQIKHLSPQAESSIGCIYDWKFIEIDEIQYSS